MRRRDVGRQPLAGCGDRAPGHDSADLVHCSDACSPAEHQRHDAGARAFRRAGNVSAAIDGTAPVATLLGRVAGIGQERPARGDSYLRPRRVETARTPGRHHRRHRALPVRVARLAIQAAVSVRDRIRPRGRAACRRAVRPVRHRMRARTRLAMDVRRYRVRANGDAPEEPGERRRLRCGGPARRRSRNGRRYVVDSGSEREGRFCSTWARWTRCPMRSPQGRRSTVSCRTSTASIFFHRPAGARPGGRIPAQVYPTVWESFSMDKWRQIVRHTASPTRSHCRIGT